MGVAIANRKNRCDLGALRLFCAKNGTERRILDHSFPLFCPRTQGKPTEKTRILPSWANPQKSLIKEDNQKKPHVRNFSACSSLRAQRLKHFLDLPLGLKLSRSLRNDNKNFSTMQFALSFFFCLSWCFPWKQEFLDDFPLCPQGPLPVKSENSIFIVALPSLIFKRDWKFQASYPPRPYFLGWGILKVEIDISSRLKFSSEIEHFKPDRTFQARVDFFSRFEPLGFWGRKWLRQFDGRLVFFVSFCWKISMPIKFRVLGVVGFFVEGGGSANFIFMGTGCFWDKNTPKAKNFWQKKERRDPKRQGEEDRSRDLGRGWAQQNSIFRAQRFTEWPKPLQWIAFPAHFLTPKPSFTEWLALIQWKGASRHFVGGVLGSEQKGSREETQ